MRCELGGFHSEEELVRLVETYPNLIPADEIAGEGAQDGPPLRFMVLKREAGVTPGSIDLLLLDNQAVPTVVEAKLRANREIRRAVLGQGLEYVADLVTKSARDLWEIAGRDLSDFVALWEGSDEMDKEALLQQLDENLSQGLTRLIILADELPTETRKVIEFLNGHSNLLVFGMAGKQIPIDGEEKIIIVDLIGPSARDWVRKTTRGPSYADCLLRVRELVLATLRDHSPGEGGFSPAYVTGNPSKVLDFLLLHPNPQGGDHWEGELGYTVKIREGEWRVGFKIWPTRAGGYLAISEEIYRHLLQHKDKINAELGGPEWKESRIWKEILDPWQPWGCPREALASELAPRLAERLVQWIQVIQPILSGIRGLGGSDGRT